MTLRGTKWTLSEIETDLGVRIDDAGNTRWTSAQKQAAITAAVRKAASLWWEDRLDDTNTYADSTYRYNLPPACEAVKSVYFGPNSSDKPRYLVVPSRWHVEDDQLVFEKPFYSYNGNTIYLNYIVYRSNLLNCTADDGEASSTTFTSATSTFITDGVQEGNEVEISGDTGGPYYVASVDSETQLTLHKAPTAGTELTFYVSRYTDLPYNYLVYASMAELYEMVSRNRPGVDIEHNIRWASYYRQLAEAELREKARHAKAHRSY